MERGRKRSDASGNLPADKRPCSSSDFRTATETNNPSTSTSPMDTSTSPMDTNMDPVYSSDESDSDNNSAGSHESPPPSPRQAYNAESRDSGHGNFKKILEALEKNDPSEVAAALFQLCEALSFCNEDSIGYVPVEKAVPLLVKIAGWEGRPDEMLLAVRAITYLCDAMPRSADSVVRHGALPVLCARLLSIEYLDVAEQCLQALEKISKKQPMPCLQAGTISAVLAYLDFFSTSIQRTAVSAVANMCKRAPPDCSPFIMESLPQLCNLLQYSDSKFVETVTTCLTRIVDSYSFSPQLLDEICQCSVIERTVHLISVDGRALLSHTTYMNMIDLLTKLASGSLVAVKSLLELNIGSTLKAIFVASDLSHSVQYLHMDDRCNQAYEVLKLVNQLIPPAAKDLVDMQTILTKEKILTDQPNLLRQFSRDILPAFIKAVNSGSNLYISYGCVSVVSNIFYFSTPEMLVDLLQDINISSFLASLLAKKDHHVLFSALRAIEILMQKLPDSFLSSFIKEGVVYAIDALLMQEACQKSDNQAAHWGTYRCLCYTFDMSRPSQTRSCHLRDGNKDENGDQSGNKTILAFARQLKGKYFTHEAVSSEIGLTEISHKLKTCCQLLNDTIDTLPNEEYLSTVLGEVMRELCGGETMTTFEFVESGIVRSLANYLTNRKYLDKDMVYNSNSHDHCISILKRFKSFARLCFNKVDKGSDETILIFLVRKLQSALSSFDSFPVVLSHGFKHRPFRVEVPVRHTATHPCVRVSFVREDDEAELSEFEGGVLCVESTSSLAEIEKYLWPKICKKDCTEEKVSGEASSAGTIDASSSCSSEEVTSHEGRQSTSWSEDSLGGGQMESTIISEQPNLVFKIKGKELSSSITLYQSLLDDQTSLEPDIINGPKFWNDVHIVTYRKAIEHPNGHPQQLENPNLSSPSGNSTPVQWHRVPFFSSLLEANLPCNLPKSSPSFDILFMLRTLECLNRFSSCLLSEDKIYSFAEGRKNELDSLKTSFSIVPQEEFISHKLTEKLEQQMRDPLALNPSGLPLWCNQLMETSPFLFSFEARRKYFRITTFGYLLPHASSNDRNASSPRSPSGRSREKFKVDRQNLFESASKMMESKARNKALLEVEYLEEAGTGLGPTIEFYTLISHEFQKVGLGLWRGDLCGSNENQGFVAAPLGLFPRPWSPAVENLHGVNFEDVNQKFVLLGQVVAKAIKDGRIVDIPLSRALYKAILEQELSIYDILSFDPELGRTLLEFEALVKRREILRSDSIGNHASTSNLDYRGTQIEDLGLDFSLPGYTEYLLSEQNNSESVNIDNLKEYIEMVVDATTRTGVTRQLEAFKSGFNQVFPLSALKVFREDELHTVLCGEDVTWSFTELVDNIKFDHGYTAHSPPVINLLEIMLELESIQRRAFLQFVTGSPRLPPGGLASLNPKLTVVRKHSNSDTDMELPSVMTCVNYLKLPPYSTKEKLKERLLYAIREGQGSFHLS